MGRAKASGDLGFQDLVIFNATLLAKQIWRLLQNSDSLSTRIIKAKYYPNGSTLEANMGKRHLFAWRSKLSTKSVITHGLMWRIGNGQDVWVWVTCNTPIKIHVLKY